MEWLEVRLKELGKKPIELARYLGLPSARAYEMTKGKRQIQQSEISAVASFIDWPVDRVVAMMEGREWKPTRARGFAESAAPPPRSLYDILTNDIYDPKAMNADEEKAVFTLQRFLKKLGR